MQEIPTVAKNWIEQVLVNILLTVSHRAKRTTIPTISTIIGGGGGPKYSKNRNQCKVIFKMIQQNWGPLNN